MPNFIVKHTKRGQYGKANVYGAQDCFECGCCAYVCPSRISHVAYVRKAKAEIAAAEKK
jgi:electron transport complex protein RnfC